MPDFAERRYRDRLTPFIGLIRTMRATIRTSSDAELNILEGVARAANAARDGNAALVTADLILPMIVEERLQRHQHDRARQLAAERGTITSGPVHRIGGQR